MTKKDAIPEIFKGYIQKIRFKREKRKSIENFQLDGNIDHYIWNGLGTLQYKVILGDFENIVNRDPQKDYSLVIANIPHGYNIQEIVYDGETYTYQALNKVVKGFVEVTTSPLLVFLVFHSDSQLGLVLSSFKGKANSRNQIYWYDIYSALFSV